MKHIKKGGLLKVKVYCPKTGVERKFSFNPTDFCPVCRSRINWDR